MTVNIKNNTKTPNCNVEKKLVQKCRILEDYTITDFENVHIWVKEIFP